MDEFGFVYHQGFWGWQDQSKRTTWNGGIWEDAGKGGGEREEGKGGIYHVPTLFSFLFFFFFFLN